MTVPTPRKQGSNPPATAPPAQHFRRMLGVALICVAVDAALLGLGLTVLATLAALLLLLPTTLWHGLRLHWHQAWLSLGSLVIFISALFANIAIVSRYETIAMERGQRIVAACEAYRRDLGQFPEKLNVLVPHYISEIPPGWPNLMARPFHYGARDGHAWLATPGIGLARRVYDFEAGTWGAMD